MRDATTVGGGVREGEGPRPGTNDEGPSPAAVRGPGRLVDVRSDQTLGLGAGALEAGRDVLPVGDVPERLDVVRLDVEVVEVEGVLPHVEHQDRGDAHRHVALLVVQLEEVETLP